MKTFTVMQSPASVTRMSIDELKALMAQKQVVVVDVRNIPSFRAGHIPGAINILFDDIPNYIEKLEKEKRQIVTYCA